jgi:hypothetical protein
MSLLKFWLAIFLMEKIIKLVHERKDIRPDVFRKMFSFRLMVLVHIATQSGCVSQTVVHRGHTRHMKYSSYSNVVWLCLSICSICRKQHINQHIHIYRINLAI